MKFRRRSLGLRISHALRQKVRELPWWKRLDTVLLLGSLVALGLLAGLWWFTVTVGQQTGWFDSSLLQPLADERILQNVRDRLSEQPILDAVFHQADNKLYIAQEGGLIQRYDPATHVWETLPPIPAQTAIIPDFVLLRSGCGDTADSQYRETCADPNALWALSRGAGLARYDGDSWRAVINNTWFQGVNGNPVESEALTAAAVDCDLTLDVQVDAAPQNCKPTWLLLGTNAHDIGLYHLTEHRWLSPSALSGTWPVGAIQRIVWWRGFFWIGAADGLFRVQLGNNRVTAQPVPATAGRVIDLDADPAGDLWILEHRTCTQNPGTDNCVWLGTMSAPDQTPQPRIDEANHYSNVNLGNLIFAQQTGDLLTLAGSSGIYTYDTRQHRWDQLSIANVSTVLPFPANDGFYFAYPQGVGTVERGVLGRSWELNERVVKLLYGTLNQEIFALTQTSQLYAMSPASVDPFPVYRMGTTDIDPSSFTAAASLGDKTVLTGQQGTLLHDILSRTYDTLSEQDAPFWLTSPDTRLTAGRDTIYGLANGNQPSAAVYALPGTALQSAASLMSAAASAIGQPVNGIVRSTWPWDNTLGVLGNDGSVYRFTPDARQDIIGARLTNPDLPLRDVTQQANTLVTLLGEDVMRYDLNTRSWQRDQIPTLSDEYPDELLVMNERLLLRTDQGRLISEDGEALIGSQTPFPFGDDSLSDVLHESQYLYLAGNGHAVKYDQDARQVVDDWNIASLGDVLIQGILNNQPLTLVNQQAALGVNILAPLEGAVNGLSYDADFIWTVRDADNHLFLWGHNRQAPNASERAQCFFRTITTGGQAGQVLDVRALPEDNIAVLTDGGLKFYSLDGRTWYHAPSSLPQADRLYILSSPQNDDYLLLVTHQSVGTVDLAFIRLADIRLPHSCSADTADVRVSQRKTVRAVAFNEASGHVAWIENDGSITEWQAGNEQSLIGQESGAPLSADFRRVYDRQSDGYLIFTTDNAIWHYDLQQRVWKTVQLAFGGAAPAVTNISIELTPDANIVTIQAAGRRYFYGTFAHDEDTLTLEEIINTEALQLSGVQPESMLDAQKRAEDSTRWTIVLADRILYFDSLTREWMQSDIFPTDPTHQFRHALDRGLVLAEGGASWLIAQTTDPHPRDFIQYALTASDQQTALGTDGRVWRLSVAGEVLSCDVSSSGGSEQYSCTIIRVPFVAKPEDVVHVFEWQNLVLFETPRGLRAFNHITGQEETLPSQTSDFYAVTATLPAAENQLLLYSDQLDRLLLFAPSEIISFDSISEAVVDDKGGVWARFVDGWRLFQGNDFISPLTGNGISARDAGIRLFAAHGSVTTGIASDGLPYFWDGTVLVASGVALPQTITPDSLNWLVHDSADIWWALSDGMVRQIVREQCVSTDQLYPVSTLAFMIQNATPTPIPPTLIPDPSVIPPTPTALPTPTHTPIPIPCYYVSGEIAIPIQQVVTARAASNQLELVDSAGSVVRVTLAAPGQLTVTMDADSASIPTLPLADRWNTLRPNLQPQPDGSMAYDPVIALVVKDDSHLYARRFSGAEHLLDDKGALPDSFTLPPALDETWLRWNRESQNFTVNSNSGDIDLSRLEFIDNGQFLFESIASVLVKSDQTFHVANQYGIWVYSQPDLNLSDPNIVFYPVALSGNIIAAHSDFLVGSDSVRVDAGVLVQNPAQDISFAIGNLQLTEHVLIPEVEAALTVGTETLPGFASRGFIWDSNRRSLAYQGTELRLQSDAGIHPVSRQYTGFDPGPSRLALTDGTLESDSSGRMYLLDSAADIWYRFDSTTWTAVSNPHANRSLLQDATWTWALQNGVLDVTLAGASYQFSITQQDGFGFSADHLRAAASFNNALYVATDAFLETASPALQLSKFQAARTNPIASDSLETVRLADGGTELYNFDGSAIYRWDATTSQFVTSAANPHDLRLLAETERLRFTWDNGDVLKEVLVDDLTGNTSWVAFDFHRGHFPFDVVTSIAHFDGDFNVGTTAGLEVFSDAVGTSLRRLSRLYDLRTSNSGTLAAVQDIGVPASAPDLLLARTTARCIERRVGQDFQPCADAGLLNTKLRLSNTLWEWHATTTGRITGQYRDAGGQLDAETIDLSGGRLPHDRTDAVTVCQGRAFSLWNQRWVTVYADETLRLLSTILNFPLDEFQPQGFICVPQPTLLEDVTVPAGIYLEGANQALMVYDSGAWNPITSLDLVAKVLDYAANPPIFSTDRLRLRQPDPDAQPYTFEHLALDGQWKPIDWMQNPLTQTWNVGIDRWNELVLVGDQLWAATTSGLITVERAVSGEAQIDPDAVELLREPITDEALCPITDMKLHDSWVYIRCSADPQQVYRGDLTSLKVSAMFAPTSIDPFVQEIQVLQADTGYWEWTLIGREGGAPGSLEVNLRGERTGLAGGQFDFDSITSLALYRDGLVEIATDRAGWFQAGRQPIPVGDLQRPSIVDNPADYKQVGLSNKGNRALLCLSASENQYLGLDTRLITQQPPDCFEYAGFDGVWIYQQTETGLTTIAGSHVQGQGTRELRSGRFTEDIAIGVPMTGLSNGRLTYWLPTQAGVVEMDADFRSVQLYTGPFTGLDPDQLPSLLYLFEGRTPAYYGWAEGARLYRLDSTQRALTDSLWSHEGPATLRAIDSGSGNSIRIHWRDETGQRWSDIQIGAAEQVDNQLVVQINDFKKYHQHEAVFIGIRPELLSQFMPAQAIFTLGTLNPLVVDLPSDLLPVEIFVFDDRVVMIGERDLWEINLETVVQDIARQQQSGG